MIKVSTKLFNSEVEVGLTNSDSFMEKVEIPKLKGKIKLRVAPQTVFYLAGVPFEGTVECSLKDLDIENKDNVGYLFHKESPVIPVTVHAGTYLLRLSNADSVKAEFALIANVSVVIYDYKQFYTYFDGNVLEEEIVAEVNGKKDAFKNQLSSVASQFITEDTSEVDLMKVNEQIAAKATDERGPVQAYLRKLGLKIVRNGIGFHVNKLAKAQEYMDKLNDANMEKELYGLTKDKREFEQKAHESENDFNVRMQGAKSPNTTVINNGGKDGVFCPHCGKLNTAKGATYCAFCGEKLN